MKFYVLLKGPIRDRLSKLAVAINSGVCGISPCFRLDHMQNKHLINKNTKGQKSFDLSPFMLSETDPDTEAGELVARDCGADETGSSTMTNMSLLLSSASASGGNEPGWSSLLREIWRCTGAHTDTHRGWGSAPQGNKGTRPVQ